MIPNSMVSDSMASILQCASNIAELLNTFPGYLLKLQHVLTKPQQADVAEHQAGFPDEVIFQGSVMPSHSGPHYFPSDKNPFVF